MDSGIYKITDLRNGKMYIGRAVNLQTRKTRHWCFLKPELHSKESLKSESKMQIHKAMLESRNENDFTFEIVEYCDKEFLDEREQFYIKKFNTLYPNGYNKTKGGNSWPHVKGEEHYNHKITQNQANQIKKYLKQGLSVKDIIQYIPEATMGIISSINNGRTWIDENETYPLSTLNGVKKYSDEDVQNIRQLRSVGMSTVELAKKYKTTTSTISSIANGKIRKDVDGPITKKFTLSENQVIEFRKEFSLGNITKKDLWRKSGVADKLSYDAFCDMLNGDTYKQYQMFTSNQQFKTKEEKYNFICSLYNEHIYTVKEIAKMANCSERTVYRAINK